MSHVGKTLIDSYNTKYSIDNYENDYYHGKVLSDVGGPFRVSKEGLEWLLSQGWSLQGEEKQMALCDCGCFKLYGNTYPLDKHSNWCQIYNKAG